MTGWRSIAAGTAVLALAAAGGVIGVLAAPRGLPAPDPQSDPRAALQAAGYEVTARFDNVGGLHVGASVTLSGVRIGRVTSVTYNAQDYTAHVRMHIDAEQDQLPADSGASIYTAGLLGERYVEIDPGGAEQTLQAGDELPLTNSAVILEHVIGQLIYGTRAVGAGE